MDHRYGDVSLEWVFKSPSDTNTGEISQTRHCLNTPASSGRQAYWSRRLLTKRIPPSRSAAADLCGSVLDWTRDGWWFRAWLGRYGMVWGARVQAACSSPVMAMVRPRACRPRMWLRIFLSRLMRLA